MQKLLTLFNKKLPYMPYLIIKVLPIRNDIVSFEQMGLGASV